jgi:hypothetical protein
MDVHMKTWTGYGKSRLSTVSFSTDPVPTEHMATSMDMNCNYEVETDYVIIPHENNDDVWTLVAIE